MKINSFLLCLIVVVFCVIGDGCYESLLVIDKEIIARNQQFASITGASEESFRENPDIIRRCILKEPSGEFSIVNVNTGTKFNAGIFKEYSLGDLDHKVEQLLKKRNGEDGKLIMISLFEENSNHVARQKVDVAAMQIDPDNKGSLFGVASNFHALETVSGSDSTTKKKINDYIHDHTQGPFASMSAMAGLIFRTYGFYYDEKTSPKTWRQTDEKQLNLLSGLGIKTSNGYVVEDSDSLYEKLSLYDAKQKFKIGYHKNVSATGGYSFDDNNEICVFDPDQVIDQIFCAGMNLDGGQSVGSYDPTPQNKESAKKILQWSYESMLKAAFVEGKKKQFLPLVGCGVFANDPSWIAEELEKQKDFIKLSGMDVVVNLYNLELSAKYDQVAKKACEVFRSIADKYYLVDAYGNVIEQ